MSIGSGSQGRLTALSAIAAALGVCSVAGGAAASPAAAKRDRGAGAAAGAGHDRGSGAELRHGARAASGSQLQVTQVEYRLRLSSATVHAGTFDLTEIDAGREFHDLRLRRGASGTTFDGRLLAPGHRWSTTVRLSPGVYTLWCSLPEHARLGMHTTLRVTR